MESKALKRDEAQDAFERFKVAVVTIAAAPKKLIEAKEPAKARGKGKPP
jgi:hypothetical protein